MCIRDSTVSRSFPLGTRVSRPRGGCVLWVELPDGYDALRLYEQARAAGIAIAPGPIFSATGRYGNCFRIAASTPWTSALEQGIQRLGELVAEQTPAIALEAGLVSESSHVPEANVVRDANLAPEP